MKKNKKEEKPTQKLFEKILKISIAILITSVSFILLINSWKMATLPINIYNNTKNNTINNYAKKIIKEEDFYSQLKLIDLNLAKEELKASNSRVYLNFIEYKIVILEVSLILIVLLLSILYDFFSIDNLKNPYRKECVEEISGIINYLIALILIPFVMNIIGVIISIVNDTLYPTTGTLSYNFILILVAFGILKYTIQTKREKKKGLKI